MTSSPCASNHASATCPAVALCFSPILLRPSAIFKMFGKFSLEYRGTIRRKSPSSKSSGPFCGLSQPLSSNLCLLDLKITHVFASDEAAPERRVRDDLDPELARCLEQPDLGVLDVERER